MARRPAPDQQEPLTLPAPKKGGALTKWDAELAKYATEAARNEADALGGRWLTQRAGQLTYAGEPMKNNEVDVIVLAAIHENVYYSKAFDPDNPQAPDCYAFAKNEAALKEMAPHADVEDKQSPKCGDCWANKFGSAEKGRGKACKNIRRIAVIPGDTLRADVLEKADIAYMKLPVLSVPLWAAYVSKLAAVMRRPPFAMVTKIKVVTDPKSQFKDTFEPVKALPTELLKSVLARVEEAGKAIEFPYGAGEEKDEAPARRQAPAKAGPKKKASRPGPQAQAKRPAEAPLRAPRGTAPSKF